ncbi:MAG: serine/threonine-protein kinase RsbW [Gaiellaceae bacterium]|nr:serine/threonine-protein kinase RsbW [Gaiellaceae bacterium]
MDTQTHGRMSRGRPAPFPRRLASSNDAFTVELEAGPDAAAWARNALFAVEQQVEEDLMADVRLLVSELVTNSVRHSGVSPPDSVGLDVAVESGTIRVEVRDGGGGFDPRPRDTHRTTPGGWGLYLVDRLADRWGVARNHFTRVWFEIDLGSARAA